MKGTGERKEEEEEKEKRKKRRRREKDCATEPQLLQLLQLLLNTFDASCFHPVFFLILASLHCEPLCEFIQLKDRV